MGYITRGVVHDYTSLSMQKQTSKHHLLSCGAAKRRHITNSYNLAMLVSKIKASSISNNIKMWHEYPLHL